MSYPPTRAQRDLMLVLQEFVDRHGVSPTLTELQLAGGFASRGAVESTLCRLKERGYIEVMPGRWRGITILEPVAEPEEPEFVALFDPSPEQLEEIANARSGAVLDAARK